MAILFIAHDGGAVIRYPLRKHLTTIGRDSRNDVVIDDPHISAFHAQIQYNPFQDVYLVIDLGSHNGTRINGRKVRTGTVSESDTLILGNREVSVLSTFKEKVPFLNMTANLVEADKIAEPADYRHRIASRLVKAIAPDLDSLDDRDPWEGTDLEDLRLDMNELLSELSVSPIVFEEGTQTPEIQDRANLIATPSQRPARFVIETVKPGYQYQPRDRKDPVVLRKALVRPDSAPE